jgi:hydroxyacylglutathione hydrolase
MSFTGFSEVSQNPHFQDVKDVAPEQVKKSQNDLVIIDIRENDEWTGELGHIDGAKLINLGNIPDQFSQIPKDKPVVVVCKSGGRSARATAFLKQQGYDQVYNMFGGMTRWNQLGLPVSRK